MSRTSPLPLRSDRYEDREAARLIDAVAARLPPLTPSVDLNTLGVDTDEDSTHRAWAMRRT